MHAHLLYLTELVGLVVYDTRGRRIGQIRDAALVPLADPARVDRFLVGGGWTWLAIRHDQVRSITLDGIHLKDEIPHSVPRDEYLLRLVRMKDPAALASASIESTDMAGGTRFGKSPPPPPPTIKSL